jgi:cytochrome P450
MVDPRKPPRARWRDFFPLQRAFGRDARAILMHLARTYGPFVRTRLPMHIYFVSGPALIEEVLVKQAVHFRKDRVTRLLSRAVGAGLIVSGGDLWRRQRRLMQPAFHQGELRSYGDVITDLARNAVASWRSGETRNVHEDLMALTLNIVAKLLFGADLAADARDIGTTISTLMEDFSGELGLRALTPFAKLPTRHSGRIRRGIRQLDRIIYKIIADRRGAADPGHDLLGLLLRARDEDGSARSDQQLRDEALTLFVAGHETTALALTYALYLLAGHPESQETLAAELAEVLPGRDAEFADLDRLKYTEAVLLEAMRLYPPAWSVGREALDDVEIGGYRVPKGSTLFMSQWVVHRDPALFEDPERFRPERWAGDAEKRLPRFAYFPFGGGPRVCIGNRFAMMEATLILAVLARRFTFIPTPETRLELLPTVTLRPRSPVKLRIGSRTPTSVEQPENVSPRFPPSPPAPAIVEKASRG